MYIIELSRSYEVERFNTAIEGYQEAEWKGLASLNVLGSGQNAIITVGLLIGALLCACRVTCTRYTDCGRLCTNLYINNTPFNFLLSYYDTSSICRYAEYV